ncbi:MAG TPA: SRPBCC family protein [Opitutus sp.]|nr:SRPBCC family protein [Opitutus sp.]
MKPNDEFGKFSAPGEVRLVRTLPGPIERAWDYLVDPGKRARWFAGGSIEPRVGGKVDLFFRHKHIAPDETPPEDHKEYHDPGAAMEGRVLRWEPPRVLSYTFGDDSDVTFELTSQGKNVQLVLTHRCRGEKVPFLHLYGRGWHTHLAQLVALLEGAPRPPFWPLHAQLTPVYEKLRAAARF